MKLEIGQLLRYPADHKAVPPIIDDLPNYFAATLLPAGKVAAMPRGITSISPVSANGHRRRPVVLIRSSPRLAGSRRAPWKDYLNPDKGHVRYFGDNKPQPSGLLRAAGMAPGNKILEDERTKHMAMEFQDRSHAAPLIFFEAEPGRVTSRASG